MLSFISTLAAIGWDPEVRGILVTVVSVVILCGSIYLIVATNTGARLGFLIAFAGLSGWMLIMGAIWLLYGIGWVGSSPVWEVEEVVTGDVAAAETAEARDLSDWDQLGEASADRAEARAVADAFVVENGVYEATTDFVAVGAHATGGKDELADKEACSIHRPSTYGGCWERMTHRLSQTFELVHPPHYLVLHLQAVEDADASDPVVDESAAVVNVVMVRDLGNRRALPAIFTLINLVLFALSAWLLHTRDRRSMTVRAGA